MILVSSCSCLCPIHWSQVLSREWRCSWGSADRRCSNYIWVINNFIAFSGATYIRGLTVLLFHHWTHCSLGSSDIIRYKQRVLMHGHQGWNVRHGLCHIYMIYVYIWVVYSFCLFCWSLVNAYSQCNDTYVHKVWRWYLCSFFSYHE